VGMEGAEGLDVSMLKAKKLLSSMSKDAPTSTFSVSYAGRCNMGSLEKHINYVYSFAEGSVPLMEISSVGGKFFFSLSTGFDGKKYMEVFAEEFERLGIKVSEIKTLHFKEGDGKTSKRISFGFNKATLELIRASKRMKKKGI